MPIEIRELIVSATIEDDSKGKRRAGKKADAINDRERIIQECVDQVLRILKEEERR